MEFTARNRATVGELAARTLADRVQPGRTLPSISLVSARPTPHSAGTMITEMGRAGIEPATLCLKDRPGGMAKAMTDARLRRICLRKLAARRPAASIRFGPFRDSTGTT